MSKNKTYTEEFKLSSAKLVIESKQTVSQIASELGVSSSTLYGWVKKLTQQSGVNSYSTIDTIQEENKLLRKELARAQQEREILKKAAAYFASETR